MTSWGTSVKILSLLVLYLAIRWGWKEWYCFYNSETFRNKNVVICGASSGIGEEIAYQYSEQGAHVILVARREEELKRVQSNCSKRGAASATYIIADLSILEEAKLVTEKSLKFGTIDVLVLNHVHYEVQRWHGNRDLRVVTKLFNVNVASYINLATLFLPSLQASRGRLVVISSALGTFTHPYFTMYCSNKHALHGFFNALRQDLAIDDPAGEGMSISLIVLGPIDTENARKVAIGNPVAGEGGYARSTAVDASREILKGSLRRDREVYYPSAIILHQWASWHFPSLTEKLIRYVYGLNTNSTK